MENKRLKLKVEYAFQDLQSLIEELVTEVENAEYRLIEQQDSYEDDLEEEKEVLKGKIDELENKIDELEDKLSDANEEIRELRQRVWKK